MPSYSPGEGKTDANIDFLGGVWRRKAIVLLIATIGAGLGWFFYTREVPTYMSRMRIMLWMQNHSSVIDGDLTPQRVALEKHRTLLASSAVLKSAIESGSLGKLKTFQDSGSAYGQLRGMLTVTGVGNDVSSDALEIRCEGKYPDDLRIILDQVVDKFIAATTEDDRELGEKSVTLIKELQSKLEQDKSRIETRYYQLVKELGLVSETDGGSFESPYLADLGKLKGERDEHLRDYRKSDQLLDEVQGALQPDQANDDMRKLVVISAKKHFSINGQDEANKSIESEEQQRILRYEQRLELVNAEVLSIDAERTETAKRFGENHPQVEFINSRYRTLLFAKKNLEEELATIRSSVENDPARADKLNAAVEDVRMREAELVRLYAASLQSQRERAKYNLEKTDEDIKTLTEKSKAILEDIVEVNMLRDQLRDSGASVGQVLEKLAALEVISNEKSFSSTRVKVIDEPSAPAQVAPVLYRFLLLGTLMGGLLGAALAVLIDHSDLAYRTPIDIQESLHAPVLCKVPKIKKEKVDQGFRGSPMLIAATKPNNYASEAFRAARTSILFAAGQTGNKVFMVTSPSPSDGKSTTIANLAISLAQTDKKVCLIDSDFRRPRVKQNFGIQDDLGATQYLIGQSSLEDIMRPCEFQNNLTLITTGGTPNNPGELVSLPAYAEMIAELRRRFDFVLIDCPPLLPVADSTSICSAADGIIMVLRIRRGVIVSAQKAKERLDLVHGNLLGVIVNGMDQNLYYNEYGAYYRGAYYGSNLYGYGYSNYDQQRYASYSDGKRS
jgi:succinoglycan biosynthesis transport protein ExoP